MITTVQHDLTPVTDSDGDGIVGAADR